MRPLDAIAISHACILIARSSIHSRRNMASIAARRRRLHAGSLPLFRLKRRDSSFIFIGISFGLCGCRLEFTTQHGAALRTKRRVYFALGLHKVEEELQLAQARGDACTQPATTTMSTTTCGHGIWRCRHWSAMGRLHS